MAKITISNNNGVKIEPQDVAQAGLLLQSLVRQLHQYKGASVTLWCENWSEYLMVLACADLDANNEGQGLNKPGFCSTWK